MSFLDSIKALFAGGSESHSAKRMYLIDAARIADDKAGSKLGPREQIQVLQQLARFVAQEKVSVVAVFEGRPLREVEDGGSFNGVTVRFADQEESVADVLMKLLRKEAGQRPVLVTGNAELEKRAKEAGADMLRASTFRKAMSGGGNGDGGGGGGGGGDRRRNMNRRRMRPRGDDFRPGGPPPQERAAPSGQGNPAEAAQPPQQDRNPEKDAVRNLIDLVE